MAELKPCKVCNFTRQKSYGLVVPSLDQLKIKGSETLGFGPSESVSVVLEDDGTIVADEAYFLCLPSNTKFMLLNEKEVWAPANRVDGGTAWLSRESVDLGDVEVDSGMEAWKSLALQLKQDLASIILMSETDLQSLVDAPCPDLATALGFSEQKTRSLQDTLLMVLDRREEERQSRELLQLYLKTVEKEGSEDAQQDDDSVMMDETDGIEVDGVSEFSSRTLMVLKGKTSPETRISNEELQMVVKHGTEAMMQVLGWDLERTSVLVQACEEELRRRLEQVQALQSLSTHSQKSGPVQTDKNNQPETKRSK
ncbi:DNA fragmentation factor subunit alpha [Chanos chanos]|uniref:DNAation factor subunit alpha n=1 Tax=Chanos chanos TaxID=29144 RepID=A0A6J2UU23_CHACN|nr:DNA fragmentation factor subunit alpha [Chanos chanos]